MRVKVVRRDGEVSAGCGRGGAAGSAGSRGGRRASGRSGGQRGDVDRRWRSWTARVVLDWRWWRRGHPVRQNSDRALVSRVQNKNRHEVEDGKHIDIVSYSHRCLQHTSTTAVGSILSMHVNIDASLEVVIHHHLENSRFYLTR